MLCKHLTYKHAIRYTIQVGDGSYWDFDRPTGWITPEIAKISFYSQDAENGWNGVFANDFRPYILREERRCKFCDSDMQLYNVRADRGMDWRHSDLGVCPTCRWWCYLKTTNHHHSEFTRTVFHEGIVHKFDVMHTPLPISVLIQHIRQKSIDLALISPKELEILVGAVIRDTMGGEAFYVGGPQDGGIDVFITATPEPIAIQVKRREDVSKTEPVSVIREFIGSMILKSYKRGIVATTATKFSRSAGKAASAEILHKFSMEVDLYNFDRLHELIEDAGERPDPWAELVNSEERAKLPLMQTPWPKDRKINR